MAEGKFYFNHIDAAALCPTPKSAAEYTILKRSQKMEGPWSPARRMGSSF